MEWMRDVSAGGWVAEHLAAGAPPRGFEACAGLFHPVFRERPVGAAWPEPGDEAAWERLGEAAPEIDAELVTWASAARALGRDAAAHSWAAIGGAGADVRDADGWRYQDPDEGRLEPEALAVAAEVLVHRTRTPDAGFAAIWDGWNGLVGGRSAVSGVPARYAADGTPQHAAVLGRSIKDLINAPFRRAAWRPGTLSDEISRGPRLEAGGRSHVLFRASPRGWSDPRWPEATPWFEQGAPWVHSPSLIWPEDRSWLLVTDPSSEITYVAGSADTVAALIVADGIEVRAIEA